MLPRRGAPRIPLRIFAAAALGASLVAVGAAPAAAPTKDEPPAGYSGGFGEDTCLACHFEADLNPSPGSLAIEGLPASYTPGESYTFTVVLTRPGMVIAGFEVTARFEGSGAQAGSLAPGQGDEDHVKVTTSSDIQYAHHVLAGTQVVKDDAARWSIRWTAPGEGGGRVLFNASANAADGDDTQFGDYIYATETGVAGG